MFSHSYLFLEVRAVLRLLCLVRSLAFLSDLLLHSHMLYHHSPRSITSHASLLLHAVLLDLYHMRFRSFPPFLLFPSPLLALSIPCGRSSTISVSSQLPLHVLIRLNLPLASGVWIKGGASTARLLPLRQPYASSPILKTYDLWLI